MGHLLFVQGFLCLRDLQLQLLRVQVISAENTPELIKKVIIEHGDPGKIKGQLHIGKPGSLPFSQQFTHFVHNKEINIGDQPFTFQKRDELNRRRNSAVFLPAAHQYLRPVYFPGLHIQLGLQINHILSVRNGIRQFLKERDFSMAISLYPL